MRIDNNGNVGIGKTDPSEKLDVSGNAIVSGKLAIGTTTPTTVDLAIGNKTGLKQQGDGNLAIYTNDSERVRIDNNSKVGIGTTSPSAKLEVKLNDTTTTEKSLKLEHNGSNFLVSPHRENGNNSTIIENTGGGSLIINPSMGNVGIGTKDPSAKLDVNGSVKLGDGSTAWNRIFCGKVIVDYDNPYQSKVFGKGISCAIHRPPGYPFGSTTPVTGLFKITFEKLVDPEKLVVIVTPQDKDTDNIVNVKSVMNDGFIIQVKNSKERTPENSSFHFIALELTENINKLVTTY